MSLFTPQHEPTRAVQMATLTDAIRLLLWSLRSWSAHGEDARRVDGLIRHAFAQAGAPDAAGALLVFMDIVAVGASRQIALSAPGGDAPTEDELRLLEAAILGQLGRPGAATPKLRDMLTPTAARHASSALEHLGAGLALQGLLLVDLENAGRDRLAHGWSAWRPVLQ